MGRSLSMGRFAEIATTPSGIGSSGAAWSDFSTVASDVAWMAAHVALRCLGFDALPRPRPNSMSGLEVAITVIEFKGFR
jgi:hypothetical protein